LVRLKELWEEHSHLWSQETKESLVQHILAGDTRITKTNEPQPSGHKLWTAKITFAVWIIFRAQYSMEKLSKMNARLVEEFPGIDPSSWKSPGFKKPRSPAKSRADVGSKPSASKEQSSRVGSEDRAYLSGGGGGGGGDDYEDEDEDGRVSSPKISMRTY
jgi:hypothetical protein